MDAVVDAHPRDREVAGAGALGPQRQVGVLAEGADGLVEAAHALEHGARVDGVAGLELGRGRVDVERVAGGAEAFAVARVGPRRALQDRGRARAGGAQRRGQPGLVGTAVVVGEGDGAGRRRAPAGVAHARGAAGAGREAQRAQAAGGGEWVVAQHGVGRRAGRVVDDHHLPLIGRRRLRGQRVEQHAQAARTLVRGHDDREQRPVAHRAPANVPAPTAAYRSANRAATPSQA